MRKTFIASAILSTLVTSAFIGFCMATTSQATALVPKSQPVASESTTLTAPPSTAPVTSTVQKLAPRANSRPAAVTVKIVSHRIVTTTTIADRDVIAATPLAIAQSQVGTHPAYAADGFWCYKAVNEWAQEAHVLTWKSEDGPAAIANDALRDGRAHSVPMAGDLVFLNIDPEHAPDEVTHIGIVESVTDGTVSTIEGNHTGFDSIEHFTYSIDDAHIVGYASFAG